MGVETEAPEETVIFLSQERTALRPPNSILPARHRLPQLRVQEAGLRTPPRQRGPAVVRRCQMAGRAPNSEMGSDGEPLRGRCGETEGGWGAGERGRWLGWTPGDRDRREERGWKAKGRVKVAREAAAPIPESLTRWGQRWGQTGTNAQWEGLSGLRGVTRHLRERVELDIWKI